MALNLYLDDCADSTVLCQLLRAAGHQVVRPRDAGITGQPDPVHLAYAVANQLILVTKNPGDFQTLHEKDANHPGIFAIYGDNNPSRDMNFADIVAAIGRIEEAHDQSGLVIAGEFHVVNHWRF